MSQSISYAKLGAVVDGLLATHPDLPNLFSVGIQDAGSVSAHVNTVDEVLAWAAALGDTPRVYGTKDERRVQAEAAVVLDGVRVWILGASECALAGVEHAHTTCVEMVQADAVVVELVGADR